MGSEDTLNPMYDKEERLEAENKRLQEQVTWLQEELQTLKEEAQTMRETLSLANCMIRCGEQHSAVSEQMFFRAMHPEKKEKKPLRGQQTVGVVVDDAAFFPKKE